MKTIALRVLVLLQLGCIALLLSGCDKSKPAATSSKRPLRLVSWGGQFEKDLLETWVDPAATAANIKLEPGSWDGEYGALTTRIKRGINEWDLVHVEDHYISSPDSASIFEVVEKRKLNGLRDPDLRAKASVAVPVLQYAYVLAYFKDSQGLDGVLKEKNKLRPDWGDFWQVSKIPGRRGMRDFPIGNIEIALASLGTNVTVNLYDPALPRAELEKTVDRAFQRLDELKPHLFWWTGGDALQKSLTSGEVTMAAAWSGRVRSAHSELCGTNLNCRLDVNEETALIATDWWIIPKGAGEASAADLLLNTMYNHPDAPKWAAAFAQKQGYSVQIAVTIKDPVAAKYLNLNSANTNVLSRISDTFWGNNYDWISRKWTTWRASR